MFKRMVTLLLMILLVSSMLLNSTVAFADAQNEESYTTSVNSNGRHLSDEEMSLDTVSLVDLLISRDYSSELWFINSYQYAYTTLARMYSIFGELESRDDAATVLLDRLVQLSSSETSTKNMMDITMLKIMLEQDVFNGQLNQEELNSLTRVISTRNVGPNFFLGVYYELAGYALTVGGQSVPLLEADKEMDEHHIENYHLEYDGKFPTASRVSSASARYNCHSYAWYDQSYSNRYWIDDGAIYVNDAHSINIGLYNAEPGDIIVYFDVNENVLHSAVVLANDGVVITCISKWGPAGVYIHAMNDVPNTYYPGLTSPSTECYRVISEHEYSILSSTSGANHVYKCSYCSATRSSAHTYTYSFDTETHTATCVICGKSVTSAHALSVIVNSGSNNHTVRCNICGASVTEAHSYRTTANSDGNTHTRTCSVCNYSISQSHNFSVVVSKNGATHTMKCNLCTQRKTEAHVKNSAGTMCIVCSYKGPFLEQTNVENDDMVNDDGYGDAIVSIHYSTAEAARDAAQVVAYGTAVKFK